MTSGLRARRFTSWLKRAEEEMKRCDYDAAFIFYWIAFNAAYAEARVAREEQKGEREAFRKYFDMIIPLDTKKRSIDAIWRKFYGPIEDILNNEYVFQPFWDYYDGVPEKTPWKTRFRNELGIKYTDRARARILNTFCASYSTACTCCVINSFTGARPGLAQ